MNDSSNHTDGAPPQPAGWYPDPSAQADLRWWDGTRWTEQTRAETDPSITATPATGTPRPSAQPTMLRKSAQSGITWWRRASWRKRAAVGFAGFMVMGGIGNAIDPAQPAKPKTTAERLAQPSAATAVKPKPATTPVTPSMIAKKGAFWVKQPAQAKVALVGYCLSDAKTHDDTLSDDAVRYVTKVDRDAVVRKIDRYYADKDEHFFGGVNADDPITDPCREAASTLAEAKATAHEKALRASVEPAHFRATTQRVRRYYTAESKEDDLRSVSCANRVTCRISINGSVGNLGKVGDFFFGDYNRDYEAQLVFDTTQLYERLFHDRKFQRGTVTTWLEVETPGGKVKKVPALTVSCDRAANVQISWNRVGPDGLRQFCDYTLRPIQGLD
jgi:hypothetical protein